MEKTVKAPKTATVKAANKEVKAVVAEVKAETTAAANENINKVVATAQEVNNQIVEAATEVVANISEVGNDLKNVATKTINEVAAKVDFTKSVKKVKTTAKKINKQVKTTASAVAADVVAEVKEKSQELKTATQKLAKEAIENLNISDKMIAVKQAIANTNTYALQTSEELITGLETNGAKWQNVTEKAIKATLKLTERNQNIMFSTLEAVKTQMGGTTARFKKLFA